MISERSIRLPIAEAFPECDLTIPSEHQPDHSPALLYTIYTIEEEEASKIDFHGISLWGCDILFGQPADQNEATDQSSAVSLSPQLRAVAALAMLGFKEEEIHQLAALDKGTTPKPIDSLFALSFFDVEGIPRELPGMAYALLASSRRLAYVEGSVPANVFDKCSSLQQRILHLRSQGWGYGAISEYLHRPEQNIRFSVYGMMARLGIMREGLLATVYTLSAQRYPEISGVTPDDILPWPNADTRLGDENIESDHWL